MEKEKDILRALERQETTPYIIQMWKGVTNMTELVTPGGVRFHAISMARINDRLYDLDEMTEQQQAVVMTHIHIQGLNSAFAGRAEFYCKEELPPLREVFPEAAE